MLRRLDVLFVNPGASQKIYQGLADKYSAIEPPTWSLLLANGCRAKGLGVDILDCDALRLDIEKGAQFVRYSNPRLVCFVVYGQNPNSGTTTMQGAIELAQQIKLENPHYKIAFIGTHTSALPDEVLAYKCVDFVMIGDGLYALIDLLKSDLTDVKHIAGLGWKDDFGFAHFNGEAKLVPTERMDEDLPGYAWDLLPYDKKPLDMYRTHFWHAEYDHDKRSPFAAIYSGLGCQMRCSFCVINSINRTDFSPGITAADSNKMRFWSTNFMLGEIDKLQKMGVENIRISDEMFMLNRKYYEPLVEGIIERGYNINAWAYARIDTVRDKVLERFRKAGIKWLGIGIESANQTIRQEIDKGRFKDVDIREVIKTVHDHDMDVGANYIFGFPEETLENMQETLDLSLELNTVFANMYCATALPGSPLYVEAKQNGWELPTTFDGYAFLGYNHVPLPTKHVSAREVLAFRDKAWQTYYTNPAYLNMIENKYGAPIRKNIEDLTKIKLKRKLLGD